MNTPSHTSQEDQRKPEDLVHLGELCKIVKGDRPNIVETVESLKPATGGVKQEKNPAPWAGQDMGEMGD